MTEYAPAEIKSGLDSLVKWQYDVIGQNLPIISDQSIEATIPVIQKVLQQYKNMSDAIKIGGNADYPMDKRDSPLNLNKKLVREMNGYRSTIHKISKERLDTIDAEFNKVIVEIDANGSQYQQIKEQQDLRRVESRQQQVTTLLKAQGMGEDQIYDFMSSKRGSRMVNNKGVNLDNLMDEVNAHYEDKKQEALAEQERAKQMAAQAVAVKQSADEKLMNQGVTIKRTSGKKVTRLLIIDESYLDQVEAFVKTLGGEIK